MTTIIRLLKDADKQDALIRKLRHLDTDVFSIDPSRFSEVPGTPFAYWISESFRRLFSLHNSFESGGRAARAGLTTTDDFRFVRCYWEVTVQQQVAGVAWPPLVKGGRRSPFFAEVPAVIRWAEDGRELKALITSRYGNAGKRIFNEEFYFSPGITWPLRGIQFSASAVGSGAVFSGGGKMAFTPESEQEAILAICNSSVFDALIRLFAGKVGGVQYEAGLIGKVPVPELNSAFRTTLSELSMQGWLLRMRQSCRSELSRFFTLPVLLRVNAPNLESRVKVANKTARSLDDEVLSVLSQVDSVCIELYGVSESDIESLSLVETDSAEAADQPSVSRGDDDEDDVDDELFSMESESEELQAELLSWTVGVAFGRFDLRLATGDREAPPEPDPFDPLPTKSPGMLPEGDEPFHANSGILVDDQGHPQDLAHLVEEVLAHVKVAVADDARRWLHRDFFPFHLQRYSKSRRNAPIYWPLSTTTGSYTLWVYYPSLTSQTLYTAINDFIEPKLKQVGGNVTALRNKGSARTSEDEKQFEALQAFELELIELRDTLLKLAPVYKPNQDDGVQISAAPLWPLFRHKHWQKLLKDTWAKLEKGDYDWAHLAMNYWPDRVGEKCKSDKSLAIAHGLEDLFIEPEAKPKKTRGKKAGGDE